MKTRMLSSLWMINKLKDYKRTPLIKVILYLWRPI